MILHVSKRWLNGNLPPISSMVQLISTFLTEQTIVDWTTFTFQDVESALEQLIHYVALDWVYDELEDDQAPNCDNDWHKILHVFEMTAALKTLPGECPPDIPFY